MTWIIQKAVVRIEGSPDGRFVQAKGPDGQPTGVRIDGGHKPSTHPDPRAQQPHGHVPAVTNGTGIKGAALWFANAVACRDGSVLGVLAHIESVLPATATSMRGATRRFGSGARIPQAAVRLESRRGHHLAFPGALRARIGSM